MARKRTRNRISERAEFDEEEKQDEEELEEEEEEEEEEEGEEDDGDSDADSEEDLGDDDDEDRPKKKPKKKPKVVKPAGTKRSRSAKTPRMKAVWVVFDNSSKVIETFPYSQKKEAEQYMEEKNTDKKAGHYVLLQKVPFDEK